MEMLYVEAVKQLLEIFNAFVFSGAKTKCQRGAGVMVDGPPNPALPRFIVGKTPHLVHFRFSFGNDFRTPPDFRGRTEAAP